MTLLTAASIALGILGLIALFSAWSIVSEADKRLKQAQRISNEASQQLDRVGEMLEEMNKRDAEHERRRKEEGS